MGTRDTVAHPCSEAELAVQSRFKTVVTATRKRLQDASKMQQDILSFKSQTKFRTLYQYVFNQEWSAYQD